MQVYCYKHGTMHVMHQGAVERILYQYQFRIAEAATSKPLPPNNPLTTLDHVVKTAFCPVEDAREKNQKQWRKFVDDTLGLKRRLLRLNSQSRARRTRIANKGKEITSTT